MRIYIYVCVYVCIYTSGIIRYYVNLLKLRGPNHLCAAVRSKPGANRMYINISGCNPAALPLPEWENAI